MFIIFYILLIAVCHSYINMYIIMKTIFMTFLTTYKWWYSSRSVLFCFIGWMHHFPSFSSKIYQFSDNDVCELTIKSFLNIIQHSPYFVKYFLKTLQYSVFLKYLLITNRQIHSWDLFSTISKLLLPMDHYHYIILNFYQFTKKQKYGAKN